MLLVCQVVAWPSPSTETLMEENFLPERCVAKGEFWQLPSFLSYLEEHYSPWSCARRDTEYMWNVLLKFPHASSLPSHAGDN